MLKKLNYNGRIVPVPVPLKDLESALTWVCDTLMNPDEMITKVMLEGQEVTENFDPNYPVTPETKLEVRADSPSELSAQTLDALCNMAAIMYRGLKPIAVKSWQTVPTEELPDAITLQDDLELMIELIDNCAALVPEGIDAENLRVLGGGLQYNLQALRTCYGARDWKQFARVLLNKLEPCLNEVTEAASFLQSQVFSNISEKATQQV